MPQLPKSLFKFTSLPLAPLASQLPKPALHPATPHWPAEHEGYALAKTHLRPQAPQFRVSVFVSAPSHVFVCAVKYADVKDPEAMIRLRTAKTKTCWKRALDIGRHCPHSLFFQQLANSGVVLLCTGASGERIDDRRFPHPLFAGKVPLPPLVYTIMRKQWIRTSAVWLVS